MKRALPSTAARAGFNMPYILCLDVVIAGAVIAAVVAVLLPTERIAIDKAQLSEVFMQGRVGQIEMMERLALIGPTASPATQADSVVDLGGRLQLSVRNAPDSYVLDGQYAKGGAEFSLAFAPSVIQGEPIGSVNLLCGSYGARPGWTGPVQGPGTDLSEALTPAVCSARMGRKQP